MSCHALKQWLGLCLTWLSRQDFWPLHIDALIMTVMCIACAQVARLQDMKAVCCGSPQHPGMLQPLVGNLSAQQTDAAADGSNHQALSCSAVGHDGNWSCSLESGTAAATPRAMPTAAPSVACVQQPAEQLVLAPILSAGLLRSRTVSGTLGGTLPAELPPVLERESEGKDSDCSSTQKPDPASKPSSPCQSGSAAAGCVKPARAGSLGAAALAEVPDQKGEGFCLRSPGWLSPRSRPDSVDVPRFNLCSRAPSTDYLRSPASLCRPPSSEPRGAGASGCSLQSAGDSSLPESQSGAQPPAQAHVPNSTSSSELRPAPSPVAAAGSVCLGGGSPSSAEKKKGFMLALKQTLQENMQQLGKRASPGRLSKGGSKVDAQQLTAAAVQLAAQQRQ